ncbi:hypothetical protein IQ255_27085 [Pleurocapsales cyanobacterium LEGE 10410]|nr:hypothetical protein [Pleurocapsales cyanobacterium LEGE 10410]
MNILVACPCCSTPMLRCLNRHKQYWFCRNCWQEMPDLEGISETTHYRQNQIVNLSTGMLRSEKSLARQS